MDRSDGFEAPSLRDHRRTKRGGNPVFLTHFDVFGKRRKQIRELCFKIAGPGRNHPV
jgi:hypothetical protein